MPTPEERLWSKVSIASRGSCLEWTGARSASGYGIFMINRKRVQTHRAAWMFTNGDIPKGKMVCHNCDNRLCCNPGHLFIGSAKDNTLDMIAKGRHKPFCTRGESHHKSKLREGEVLQIRMLHASGVSISMICERFSISRQHANGIIKKRIWRHLTS